MAQQFAVHSETLQSITLTKIRELEKQQAKYEARKNEVLAALAQHPLDTRARISTLLSAVSELYPKAANSGELKNIKFWLQQSEHDATIRLDMLEPYETFLRSKLDVKSRKLDLAHLYSRLVTEWMSPSQPMEKSMAPAPEEESFECIDRQKERLQELCDKFEKVVFEPLETDENEINAYLTQLFQGEGPTEALNKLRQTINDESLKLLARAKPFDRQSLAMCIKGLLAEDLLSDEKQSTLRGFLDNKVILGEIADVLNMRFADFDSWDWQAGEQGIPVLPRQQLNGKYRIWMDEDVLQAIFIHFIGIQCCVFVKKALNSMVAGETSESKEIWRWHTDAHPHMTQKDLHRRQYYLGPSRIAAQEWGGVEDERKDAYLDNFFLSQLPDSVDGRNNTYDDGDDGESNKDRRVGARSIRQRLLHRLATELVFRRSLYGEVAIVQSDLQWFGTGLSHTTVFAFLRFFGFPEQLVKFFEKVLHAPLNMQPSSDSSSSKGPRIRRRGVPMANMPSKLIGELILFGMDKAVNQETGMLLYRLHDDLWLCGEPDGCAQAWGSMKRFAKIMGLEFNDRKTGSVYLKGDQTSNEPRAVSGLPPGPVRVGLLNLDPLSGKWVIDQTEVGNHVTQLQKQLAGCNSILEWVQTWNSCISRFFTNNFGEPALCFGVEHVDQILNTYQHMQERLFASADSIAGATEKGSVVGYLKAKMLDRFSVSDVPDAFLFLPEELGGLGLQNPFIRFTLDRAWFDKNGARSPDEMMGRYMEKERQTYLRAEKEFYAYEGDKKDLHWDDINDLLKSGVEPDIFFSFEEFSRFRESSGDILHDCYVDLLSTPDPLAPSTDSDVYSLTNNGLNGPPAFMKSVEMRWTMQLYSAELRRICGGMRLVDEEYLPLGVLEVFRKAVRWTTVL